MNDVLDRALPKWPQMRVLGKPVTQDQAKEIIRRTDAFFGSGFGGNDRAYDQRVIREVGMPDVNDFSMSAKDMFSRWEALSEWQRAWGYVRTEYVHNNWVSCSYIHGPHGWCHPDGTISFSDNVGKWPAIAEVLDDWKHLAAAFPFLELGVALMDREHSEEGGSPVAGIVVAGGEARVVDPAAEDPLQGRAVPERSLDGAVMGVLLLAPSLREHGLPWGWIEEWGRAFRERSTA